MKRFISLFVSITLGGVSVRIGNKKLTNFQTA